MIDQDSPLVRHFGTPSPLWSLTSDSDALQIADVEGNTKTAVQLNRLQAALIRAVAGVITPMDVELELFGENMKLHLIGRRVGQNEWRGNVALYLDTHAVADSIGKGLSFAEQIVSEVNCLVVVMDHEGKIRRFNKLCEEVTGLKEEDVLGMNAFNFIPLEERNASIHHVSNFFQNKLPYEMERSIQTLKGKRRIRWRNKLLRNGNGQNEWLLISAGTDVTDEREAQEKLVEQANTDYLTGLPNRHAIEANINEMLANPWVDPFALIFLDLDNFKKVNDHYGHITGDKLIQEASKTLKGCLRDGDILARLGGDEFLIVLSDATGASAELIAQRILKHMKAPFNLGQAEVYSSCSQGIAIYPDHGNTAEALIRSADTAMYVAKEQGKGAYRVYSRDMDNKVSEYVWLDRNLRKALDNNEFELLYQPKVDLRTGQVRSAEALIRWHSTEKGMVSPNAFIPYAEESGLIIPLGRWVIQEAARQLQEWRSQGLDIRVAINVSARQLCHDSIIMDFSDTLLDHRLAPSLIDIELTESCLAENEELALQRIGRFRALGCEVHLDDFGTGYSSLSQLARLPIDVLKLDRSFISSLMDDVKAKALTKSMVVVAQELGLRVIAEGVETEPQAAYLKEIGVDMAQGYLYGRPMKAAEFKQWHASTQPLRLVPRPAAKAQVGAA